MLIMLRDLINHKWYANAALLKAIREHEKAAQDEELRKLFRHILLANRFWLMLTLQRPFAGEKESKVPESLEALIADYVNTCAEEQEWLAHVEETDLEQTLETSFIPGTKFSVAQAMMQVCMHSQGHRSQAATRLRLLGGTPPATDFILWLKERSAPAWT